ncbi:hypothetical protein AG1IA_00577 [Rhizoctonia solani AG-1 IA]|uniref:Uncharacterized protein n=1 Tax=Thanatephorus cucumeris (strain AG1-IA) TaxID=983506 RepID=L8X510_THACA|nr:hypothetical protein AG1IA_00577 [Rhizoctonia solani AG-1 IA]
MITQLPHSHVNWVIPWRCSSIWRSALNLTHSTSMFGLLPRLRLSRLDSSVCMMVPDELGYLRYVRRA